MLSWLEVEFLSGAAENGVLRESTDESLDDEAGGERFGRRGQGRRVGKAGGICFAS